MRSITNPDAGISDLLYLGKLRAKDLKYFNPDYESENNKSIISVSRYIYYRDIFV